MAIEVEDVISAVCVQVGHLETVLPLVVNALINVKIIGVPAKYEPCHVEGGKKGKGEAIYIVHPRHAID